MGLVGQTMSRNVFLLFKLCGIKYMLFFACMCTYSTLCLVVHFPLKRYRISLKEPGLSIRNWPHWPSVFSRQAFNWTPAFISFIHASNEYVYAFDDAMDMTSEIKRQQRKDRWRNNYKKTSMHGLHLIVTGDWLVLVPQDNNEHNKHAVVIMNNGCIVRYVPECISQVLLFYIF